MASCGASLHIKLAAPGGIEMAAVTTHHPTTVTAMIDDTAIVDMDHARLQRPGNDTCLETRFFFLFYKRKGYNGTWRHPYP